MRVMGEALLQGRVAVVTGANSGIGREIARALLGRGARVVLACRSEKRGQAAAEALAAEGGAGGGAGTVDLQVVDLSSMASTRAFIERIRARYPKLDILVNNASIWPETREVSVEGIERTWATNVLAYFLLMTQLAERLRGGRIVNVASDFAGGLDLDDPELERRPWSGTAAYRQSKQAERMLTWGMAERAGDVTVNAYHPGGVDTRLFRYQSGLLGLAMAGWARLAGRTPEQGADTGVWLATAPELAGVTGRYWHQRTERPCRFRDYEATQRLWSLCEAQVADGD